MPDALSGVGPRIRQAAFVNTVEELGQIQSGGRPFVELLKSRDDHSEIEESAETQLIRDVPNGLSREGILIGEDPRELKEDAGHPKSGITEQRRQWSQPSKRQLWRGDQSVGVEHPTEHDVHEKALGSSFVLGQIPVVDIGRDHACVVGSGTRSGHLAVQRRLTSVQRAEWKECPGRHHSALRTRIRRAGDVR